MPLDLVDFKNQRGRVETLDYGTAGSLVFTWHPDRLTEEVFGAITDGERRGAFELAKVIIVPLVSSWDVTEQGVPLPITEEAVASLGLFVVSDMVQRITQGINEDDTKKASAAG